MSNFETKSIDFGIVKAGSKLKIEFKGTDDIKEIRTIRPSCGCTSVKYDKENNKVIVNYTAGNVPQHLLNDGINHYKTTKNITVVYVDGDTDILSFSVHVKM